MTFLEPDLIVADGAVVGESISLASSRCVACDRADFPRRDACSACGSETRAHSLAGPAGLSNRTAVLHAPPGAVVEVPYEIGVAEFDDGIAVLGLLLDGDAAERGCDLDVVAAPVGHRMTYAFRPTGTTSATPSSERN